MYGVEDVGNSHPESIISSSTPYSFICCKPQPSFILLGINRFLNPVRLGVWNIRTSTLSPCSATNEARSEAHDCFGVSRVPRRASVRIETVKSGFFRRDSFMTVISSCSAFPMYNVER